MERGKMAVGGKEGERERGRERRELIIIVHCM